MAVRIAVIGAGALGSYFGARLMQAGHDVVFVARGHRLQVLSDSGLTIATEHGTEHFRLDLTDSFEAMASVDLALLCVKTWHIPGVIALMQAGSISPQRLLTLQNGVEAHLQMGAILPAGRILSGIAQGFFEMEQDCRVRHAGVPPKIIFGALAPDGKAHAAWLAALLGDAAILHENVADIEARLWEKLLLASSVGAVGACAGKPMGAILDEPDLRGQVVQMMDEITTVAQAAGIALDQAASTRMFDFVRTFPPEATTSMQRDLMEGRPSELDAQLGVICRLGWEYGVSIPLVRALYNSLAAREAIARGTQPQPVPPKTGRANVGGKTIL
jgi:2-dehydropantoate 2-reductase